MSFIPLKMHSELNWAFVSIIKFSHRSISSCPALLHQQGAPEPITPPDEQSQGMHHGVQSLPMQAANVAMHVVAPTAATLPNIYADVINDTFSMQFVLSMDSACECHLNVLFNFY